MAISEKDNPKEFLGELRTRPFLPANAKNLALDAHILAGIIFTIVPAYFGFVWWKGPVIAIVFEIFKEGIWDPIAEGHPQGWIAKWKSGFTVDLPEWLPGIAIGLLFIALKLGWHL